MVSVELERRIAAPAEVVFDVITDHRDYARITPLRGAELEREGDEAPNGTGAVRALRAAPGLPPLREVVTAFEPPRRFVYELISGAPIRDHRGTVELESASDSGCILRYRIEARPAIPLTGAVVRIGLGQAQRMITAGVVAEAERRAAQSSAR